MSDSRVVVNQPMWMSGVGQLKHSTANEDNGIPALKSQSGYIDKTLRAIEDSEGGYACFRRRRH